METSSPIAGVDALDRDGEADHAVTLPGDLGTRGLQQRATVR